MDAGWPPTAPTACIHPLAFAPDGNVLAGISSPIGDSGCLLYLWHAPSLGEIAAAEQNQAAQRAVR